jgi:hypothetical protein
LVVVPTLTPEGRIRLQFTPEVRHGQATVAPQPDRERTMWLLQRQQPTETYAALNWEVTLGPKEYLVIGGHFNRPETLGYRFFVQAGESASSQRLLVVRAAASAPAMADDNVAPTSGERAVTDRVRPLALQAASVTIHASGP